MLDTSTAKERKAAFRREVEKHNGFLKHDYADDLHYQYLLDLYGGKELLKSEFPLVYEVMEQTRTRSLKKEFPPVDAQNAVQDDMKEEFLIDFIDFGNANKYSASESTSFLISACMRANLLNKADSISVRGFIYDSSDLERPITVINDSVEQSYQLESHIRKQLSLETLPPNMTYRAEATFTYFKASFSSSVTVNSDFLIRSSGSFMIKNITVNAPKYKTPPPPSPPPITLVYDRDWFFPQDMWDYSYNNVVVGQGTNLRANVYVPFSGSITADDRYIFLPFDKNQKFMLQLIFKDGAAEYQNTANLASYFTLSDDKKTMYWNFDDDWKTLLDLSRFAAIAAKLKFYCNMKLPMKLIDTNHVEYRSITIESDEANPDSPSNCHIPYIRIVWGCLARGTKIKMADGQEKNVEDLRPGDSVLTSEGKKLPLRNLITGTEKTMIYLETFGNHNVMVTQTHPVFTTRGVIEAGDITPADSIYTIDGAEKVRYCFPIDYNDTVYSPYFDGENGIFCNGLILGDFNMQNSVLKPDEPELTAEQPSPLTAEWKRLHQALNKAGVVHE